MYVLYVLCFTHRHFFVDNSSPKEKEQRANEVKRMRTSICPSYTRCCFVHFANWCLCVSNWEWQGMIASLVTAAVSMSAILFLASKLKCPLPWDWERMTHCRNVVKCGWDVNDVPAWWQWKFFALFFLFICLNLVEKQTESELVPWLFLFLFHVPGEKKRKTRKFEWSLFFLFNRIFRPSRVAMVKRVFLPTCLPPFFLNPHWKHTLRSAYQWCRYGIRSLFFSFCNITSNASHSG